MKHLHLSKSLKKNSSNFFYITIFVSILIILFLAIFFTTRGANPLKAELQFTSHSILGKDKGSIVPASCESGIPHYTGDCTGATVGIGFSTTTLSFEPLTLSLRVTPFSAGYNESITLTWEVTGATDCQAFNGWTGGKSYLGGSEVILYQNPGSVVQNKTYTMICSKGKKSISKKVTVGHLPFVVAP